MLPKRISESTYKGFHNSEPSALWLIALIRLARSPPYATTRVISYPLPFSSTSTGGS